MFKENISLAPYSNLKIGGLARYFFEAKSVPELTRAVLAAKKMSRPIFILGGGTNILFRREDFDAAVIRPNIETLVRRGNTLRVGAGVTVPDLLEYCIAHSLSGLEWAGGLPGTVGGAVYGNAGCFGGEIKDIVREVVSLSITNKKPKIIRRKNDECGFGYRSSVFKKKSGQEVITEVVLELGRGKRRAIKKAIEDKIRYREERQPLDYPNIGSIFKNVDLEKVPKNKWNPFAGVIKTDPFPVIPAAYLVSAAGLKGVSAGGAMISPKHPNFIVNALQAEADDVLRLAALAKKRVKEKFGILLEEEVIII